MISGRNQSPKNKFQTLIRLIILKITKKLMISHSIFKCLMEEVILNLVMKTTIINLLIPMIKRISRKEKIKKEKHILYFHSRTIDILITVLL